MCVVSMVGDYYNDKWLQPNYQTGDVVSLRKKKTFDKNAKKLKH